MSFNAKNPMIAPMTDGSPPPPIPETRGLFPKKDGWYDIDEDGNEEKILSESDIQPVENKLEQISTRTDGIQNSENDALYVVDSVGNVKVKISTNGVEVDEIGNLKELVRQIENFDWKLWDVESYALVDDGKDMLIVGMYKDIEIEELTLGDEDNI